MSSNSSFVTVWLYTHRLECFDRSFLVCVHYIIQLDNKIRWCNEIPKNAGHNIHVTARLRYFLGEKKVTFSTFFYFVWILLMYLFLFLLLNWNVEFTIHNCFFLLLKFLLNSNTRYWGEESLYVEWKSDKGYVVASWSLMQGRILETSVMKETLLLYLNSNFLFFT